MAARDFTEAIVWHGGEAQPSREQFSAMPELGSVKRVAFLRSL
jgi:CxxC motif-containing protein (DUF1111 family)